MSVENFDGDGFADQPSTTNDQDDLHIKELSCSGHGGLGLSSGDVDRDTYLNDENGGEGLT